MPPSPVPIVATAYASETSARGQPNSAASGVRNTAMVKSTPNPMAAITVETATMSHARCMRRFYVPRAASRNSKAEPMNSAAKNAVIARISNAELCAGTIPAISAVTPTNA